MTIGPGAIMGRWAATKIRDAIFNRRKNKKENQYGIQSILHADNKREALKNYLESSIRIEDEK